MIDLIKAKASTRNIHRDRSYGLRVGDTVDWEAFQLKRENGIVVSYLMDNNAVMVQWPGMDEPVKEVAEWCTVTQKIEDKIL